MYYREGKNSCRHIVEHDSGAFRKFLQLPHRRRLDDIECSKKYKTREESLPCKGNGDECDELSGDFVDDDELGIFSARSARHTSGGGYADQGDENS